MRYSIVALFILSACSSPTENEQPEPTFDTFRIGTWEVFAEDKARWVGQSVAAKATGDTVVVTTPEDYGFFITEWPDNAGTPPGDLSAFVVELQDSTITELPEGRSNGIVRGRDYQVTTLFDSRVELTGLYPDDGHMKFQTGYYYDCEEALVYGEDEMEGDEVIEFWHDFSGEKKVFTFSVDGYLETIHHIACD